MDTQEKTKDTQVKYIVCACLCIFLLAASIGVFVNIAMFLFINSTMNKTNSIIASIDNTIKDLDKTKPTFTQPVDINNKPKAKIMRITGYTPTGNKTALGRDVVVGRTAAVSPACAHIFLGEWVYIEGGYGVRQVTDLTADWLDEKFNVCTIDLAVATKEDTKKIGNSKQKVIIVTKAREN